MEEDLNYSNVIDIASYPEEFLDLRDFIMLSTSLVDKDFKLIFGKGFLKDSSKYVVRSSSKVS